MRYGNALMFANPGAAMTQGFAQATQMKEMGRQNALADLYRDQGAAIARGDPNALALLAQHDPMAARGIQRENASDSRAVEMLNFARERAKREAEKWAKSVSAEEAGAAAAKVQSILEAGTVLYKQGDRDGYNRYLHQNGMDPVEYPFEDLPMNLAKLKGYEEGFAPFVTQQPKPLSPAGKLAADLEAGLISQEQFDQASKKSPLVDMSGANFGGDTTPQNAIPMGKDGAMLVPDAESPSGWRFIYAENSPAQTKARGSAIETASAQAKTGESDRQSKIKMGTSLQSIHLNLKEISDGGLPVTGVWGEARRTTLGRMLTGEGAVDFENRTNQVTDAAALDEVMRMRQNSPTGGAVGALTDGERVAIGNAVTALNSATSAEEYARAAEHYRKTMLDIAFKGADWEINDDGTVTVTAQLQASGVPDGIDPAVWAELTDEQRALWEN